MRYKSNRDRTPLFRKKQLRRKKIYEDYASGAIGCIFFTAHGTELTLCLRSLLDKAKLTAWSVSRTQSYRITWPLNQLKITA